MLTTSYCGTIWNPTCYRYLTHQEKVFNYHTSRARRVSENGFHLLVSHFLFLLTPMLHKVQRSVAIVMSCLCLHNLMREW